MQKPFVIRDPVHGYLQVAAHERILIDHQVTQRLRHISQTGLAYLVYPEARTSRFAHSLGAMHLSSRFILACIENADEKTALKFFAEIERLDLFRNFSVKLEDLDLFLITDRIEGGGGLSAPRVLFGHNRLRKDATKYRRLLALTEAGLRLAALFHDLGHLPFSHDLEFALEEYVSDKLPTRTPIHEGLKGLVGGPPHEIIGHRLASLVFQSLVGPQTAPAIRAAFAMGRKILSVPRDYYQVPRPKAGAIPWLHSLVDGEIDVDRADYLLRDGRALGFKFAVYDIDRLVNNLVLVQHPVLGFTTAIEERGFSALESFYLSRARSHQFLVRHHKVAQISAAFRNISVKAFASVDCVPFLHTLSELGSEDTISDAQAQELLVNFGKFDDTWWLQLLPKIETGGNPLLDACKQLVLRRQPTLTSMWKRKGDLSTEQIRSINRRVERLLAKRTGPPVLNRLRADLAARGLLAFVHKFYPYRVREASNSEAESLMLLKTGKGELLPVSRHSCLIQSLEKAWAQDVHFQAFGLATRHFTLRSVVRVVLGKNKSTRSHTFQRRAKSRPHGISRKKK